MAYTILQAAVPRTVAHHQHHRQALLHHQGLLRRIAIQAQRHLSYVLGASLALSVASLLANVHDVSIGSNLSWTWRLTLCYNYCGSQCSG
eukprot:COSAG02_NODE_42885_length_380_cov_0.736655_1_plen_89_part_10